GCRERGHPGARATCGGLPPAGVGPGPRGRPSRLCHRHALAASGASTGALAPAAMMARVISPTRWPEARATRGMVAAPHVLAAEAGRAIFAAGGNAVDAAVAAAATIAVVYPHMNSIGGDNFWLICDARARQLRALKACGRSAAQVNADAYRARYGVAMPVRGGAAAIMVPGVVSGWWEAHRMSRETLGSPIPWKGLLEDAVRHARDGFAVSPGQRRVTAGASALFAATAPEAARASFWPIYPPDGFGNGRFVQG